MLTLLGSPYSTYTRSALLVLAEKGVPYTLVRARFRDPDYPHPWKKMPVLDHDGALLYEAIAILRYVDEAFDGPALQPADALGRARVAMWMSAYNDYVAPYAVRGVLIPRLVWPDLGIPVDEARVAKSVAAARASLEKFEAQLATSPFLAGDQPTLADWLLLPTVVSASVLPESEDYAKGLPRLSAWADTLCARPSFAATQPTG